LAYLSACSTAKIEQDDELADEAIHLGNLFQALGFAHVIATLWNANDVAAGEIAKRFYEKLLSRGEDDCSTEDSERLDAAGALHAATLEYRNAFRGGDHAFDWVPFIHIGA
jgi:CHAT domain-containing protein